MTKHTPSYQVQPLEIYSTRGLTSADLVELASAPQEVIKLPTIKSLSSTHHSVAQNLVKGIPPVEVSLITGVAVATVYNLQQDPAFQELLAHYKNVKEQIFIDTLDRMKTVGINALDILQYRLMEKPESLSNRELMELADLGLVKGRVGAGGAAGNGNVQTSPASGVTINVKFVEPGQSMPALTIDEKVSA